PLESSNPQPTTPPPEGELPQPNTPPPDTGGVVANATGDHVSPGEEQDGHKESVAAFQKVLLRDLKIMKNRQVIHPVLQEAAVSSEPPSKNLSAFCSDMLDEYLEN
ncbi:hypothetical protein CRUP_023076, partial [Coryphaenoides rupestris]